MNLKIKITLETRRLLLLRSRAATRFWCAECEIETFFVAEDETGEVLSELEANKNLHKITTSDGKVLVCLESLLNPAE